MIFNSEVNQSFVNSSVESIVSWNESHNGTTNFSITIFGSDLTTLYPGPVNSSLDFNPEESVESNNGFYWMSALIMALISIIIFLLFILRKRRFDKLRLNLMPVYKFDPSEESAEDWETELLDANVGDNNGSNSKSRQLYTNERPQLSFARV